MARPVGKLISADKKASSGTRLLGPMALVVMLSGLLSASFSETLTLEQVIREVCMKSDSAKMMKESIFKSGQMVREKWSNALPVISASANVAENHGSLFGGSSSSSASRSSSSSEDAIAMTTTKAISASTPPTLEDQVAGLQQEMSGLLASLQTLSKPMTSTAYTTGLSISQPLFTFGKIGTALEVAKQFDNSARQSFNRNMQTLQLTALDNFFHVVLAEKTYDVAQRSLERKKEMNEFLDRNFKLNSGSKAQVLSTRADVLNQSAVTLIAKRDAGTARMLLNAFIGRSLTDSISLDTVVGMQNLVNTPLPLTNDAVKTGISDRADLKSMKFIAESYKGGAKIFRAMNYPSIGLMGSLGYSKMQTESALFKMDWTGSWMVGVGAQWTLFDGFSSSAKAAQYLSDANKMEITCNTISNMIEIDIRSDMEECRAADSNLASSEEMLNSALEGYDLTYSNFKLGSGQLSDLQHVDDLLQQAELGLTNARYRQVRSRAALLVAMGRDIVEIK
jgi:HAE1 family hydrophobic/amphiphilic exporter-1